MDGEWPPPPPDGYQPHNPKYHQPWYVTAGLFVWLVGVFVGIPELIVSLHGLETAVGIVLTVFQPNGATEWLVYVGWIVGVLGVLIGGHEALHALAGHWIGLRTRFRFEYRNPLSWSPELVTYGEFQTRSESLCIVLCPLVVLTPVSFVVLVVGHGFWMVATAAVIALGNSASAVGDLASAAVLWHLSKSELIYHDNEGRRQYYAPTTHDSSFVAPKQRRESAYCGDNPTDEHCYHSEQHEEDQQ